MKDQALKSSPAAAHWLQGGGEMGKVVAAKDWSKTPLGPIEAWPQNLRTTVSLCLASNFPIAIAWGPHRVQIYNDGYWPITAAKHPESMGQDFKQCWFSAWPVIGDAFERASRGETCFLVNQRMFLDRLGYLEETFFTFSFSPIRDESGGVAGLFHPVTELTQQSLAERRLEIIRDLADHTTNAKTVDQASQLIAETLGRSQLDLPFVLLYLLDAGGNTARLVQSVGLSPATGASPVLVDLKTAPSPVWPLPEVARSRQTVQVSDLEQSFGSLACGPYPESPNTALVFPICLPALDDPLAVMVVGVSPRRVLDAPYRQFYDMLGEAVTSALAKARAYEEERKRAEALSEIDRAKTAFFSNVSHEFRTPLTLMLGPLEDELRQNPACRERLEVAHRNSLRLLKLVNTLLDFSRFEAGRIHANFEPTDLAAYTAELASVFRSATEKAGLKLIVNCAPLPQPVYVDREMWEKIVLNLLSNAFKFTFEGEIEVALQWCGERVELSVRDTGTGIPEAELGKVFERFHRVRGARSRTHEGTGIGLSLVHELARLHGGEVKVQSQEGRGSTFVVAVRTGKAHLPPEHISTISPLPSTGLGTTPFVEEALRWLPDGGEETDEELGRLTSQTHPGVVGNQNDDKLPARILLADDNADMREYVRRLLVQEGYQVVALPDGEAALEAARRHTPDLVLADVMMPRLDGFGLLRALRESPSTNTLPIILLSARAGEESRVEGLAHGADDYLIKPFSARELLARVEAHLRMARLRAESQRQLRQSAELSSRSREQLTLISDSVPALISYVDTERRYRMCNRAYESWFALSREQIIGKTMEEVLGGDAWRSVQPHLDAAFSGATEEFETEAKYRHGVARWVRAAYTPHRDASGNVHGVVLLVTDITARKQAELALRESEERFRNMANNAPVMIWITETDASCSFLSQSWYDFTGQTPENALGVGWVAAVHPDDQHYAHQTLLAATRQRTAFRVEYRLRRKDGTYRWAFDSATPRFDARGEFLGYIGSVIDIHERKEAERLLQSEAERLEVLVQRRTAKLQEAIGQLEAFSYSVAHDLRAPLRAMSGYADELRKEPAVSPQGQIYVQRIQRAAERLDRLTQEVLSYSRLAREEPTLEPVNLDKLARDIIDEYPELSSARTNIEVYAPLLPVVGNEPMLAQVLSNLLVNACKFVPPGVAPKVRLWTEPCRTVSSFVRIVVEDNGIGIAPEHRDRLFKIFGRINPENKYGGTGIGLAIVRKAVELMGGTVGFDSKVGKGSSFWVRLPKA